MRQPLIRAPTSMQCMDISGREQIVQVQAPADVQRRTANIPILTGYRAHADGAGQPAPGSDADLVMQIIPCSNT